MMLLFPVVMIVGMYFLLIMPMQKQKKQQKELLENLKTGDAVVTTGGLVGTIFSMDTDRDTVVLRVRPDNLRMEIARNAVAGLVQEGK